MEDINNHNSADSPLIILGKDGDSNIFFLFHDQNYGYLRIDGDGFGILTGSKHNATRLKRIDSGRKCYLMVDSGMWKGRYLGPGNGANDSYLTAVKSVSSAKHVNVSHAGADQNYYAIKFGHRNFWVIRSKNVRRDRYIRLNERLDFEMQTFIKPYVKFPFEIKKSNFWLFIRHNDEENEQEQSFFKAMVVQTGKHVPFDVMYQMACELNLDIRGVPVVFSKQHYIGFHHEKEQMHEDRIDMNKIVRVKVRAGCSLWTKVHICSYDYLSLTKIKI